jgi:hypothetical protein
MRWRFLRMCPQSVKVAFDFSFYVKWLSFHSMLSFKMAGNSPPKPAVNFSYLHITHHLKPDRLWIAKFISGYFYLFI